GSHGTEVPAGAAALPGGAGERDRPAARARHASARHRGGARDVAGRTRGRRRGARAVTTGRADDPPESDDRAIQALEDQDDVRAAARARAEQGSISYDQFVREIGL